MKIAGPIGAATLAIAELAPCSGPCSDGLTCWLINPRIAGPASHQSDITGTPIRN